MNPFGAVIFLFVIVFIGVLVTVELVKRFRTKRTSAKLPSNNK
jgi:uncharacterized protein YybS (DUF2232 family)